MIQSEATKKPVARARGGIASESGVEDSRPDDGERRRDHAVQAAIAIHSVGAKA